MNKHRSDRSVWLSVVTNIPAPYRVPIYNRFAANPAIQLQVTYPARSAPDRQENLPEFAHEHVLMGGSVLSRQGRFIHHNPGVLSVLSLARPDVVVTIWAQACSRLPQEPQLRKRLTDNARLHVADCDAQVAADALATAVLSASCAL